MLLTTKGRYAVMAIVDMAKHGENGPVTLSEIEARQHITVNYLEQIFNRLRICGIVSSIRGPGGGYVLAQPAEKIKIIDIIRAAGEPIKMTRCDNTPEVGCMPSNSRCLTHKFWARLSNHIEDYLAAYSVADIISNEHEAKEVMALGVGE